MKLAVFSSTLAVSVAALGAKSHRSTFSVAHSSSSLNRPAYGWSPAVCDGPDCEQAQELLMESKYERLIARQINEILPIPVLPPQLRPRPPPNPKNTRALPSTSTTSSPAPTTTSSSSSATRTTSTSTTSSSSSSSSAQPTTTTSTAPYTGCTATYSNPSHVVQGPGRGVGIPFMPRPTSFVERWGDGSLGLDNVQYRITGPNIYWLGLDENAVPRDGSFPEVAYPSKQRVREAFAIAVAMGANTVRSISLGVSIGRPLSLLPSRGVVNEAAWDSIDYAIFAARVYGIRLIIPLTDNYKYYHGGKFDFLQFAGLDTGNPRSFYYDNSVIQLYKDYITLYMNHINAYTGIRNGDEPAILAWETGNELGGYFLGDLAGPPPAVWTNEIALHIKSLSRKTLIADGTDGLIDMEGFTRNTGLEVGAIDLVTDHFYPAASWLLEKDAAIMSRSTKNYYVGESDWIGQRGGSDVGQFLRQLEGIYGSGSMMWSIFGHDDRGCDYVLHNDGYSLYYPDGNPSLQGQALLLVQHWYRMRGAAPPARLPAVVLPQPELLA